MKVKSNYKSFMSIKCDVLNGQKVFWASDNYRVEYDRECEDFIIRCLSNNDIVGLKSESNPEKFYIYLTN